jgi:hypothetical protein
MQNQPINIDDEEDDEIEIDETKTQQSLAQYLNHAIAQTDTNFDDEVWMVPEQRRSKRKRTIENTESSSNKVQKTSTSSSSEEIDRIENVYVRPFGKKELGTVESSETQIKFISAKNDESINVIVLYSNVRYAFIQRATGNDKRVIIHFNLINHIVIGKKERINVQICSDIGKNNREEKNTAFEQFSNRISRASGIQFGTPQHNNEFQGTINAETLKFSPTDNNCIVSLWECPARCPFFVVSLRDIATADWRIGVQYFDLQITMRDNSNITISSIDKKKLKDIQQLFSKLGSQLDTAQLADENNLSDDEDEDYVPSREEADDEE